MNGSEYLPDIAVPSLTNNRLYANGGSLYWAGNVIAGGATGTWTSDGTNVWRTTGDVGIGTTSPSATLAVNGTGFFSGDLGASGPLEISSKATSTFTGPLVAPIIDNGGQVFNVAAFGAAGDGTTDDTTAIQNAINAACNANGGTVLLGADYYKISSTLTLIATTSP